MTLIRRSALFKEVLSIRMAAEILRNHNEFSSQNKTEYGDSWLAAMVGNATAAIRYDFDLKHRPEVPAEDLGYYDSYMNAARVYSTNPDVGTD